MITCGCRGAEHLLHHWHHAWRCLLSTASAAPSYTAGFVTCAVIAILGLSGRLLYWRAAARPGQPAQRSQRDASLTPLFIT